MKPIAWIDKNTGKPTMEGFIQTDYDIPLYTHPAQELNAGGEPVKNATYWKKQHDRLLMQLNVSAIKITELEKESKRTKFAWNLAENELETLKYEKSSGVYDLEKTLTDEEIIELFEHPDDFNCIDFARAILRKAQEK